MTQICANAADHGLPVYLYGSQSDVLERLVDKLRRTFPALKIAGAEPSKFRGLTKNEVVELNSRLIRSGAKIVFVGLGCPRQEVFVYEHCEALSCPVIAVGAAFDFVSGSKAQAPSWMRLYGLEWLFRLFKEPARLWRRYIFLNPLFCLLVFRQRFGMLSPRPERPPQRRSFG
jgi:exopolysaccharide biosynthesis WecB/TagA/CpsF family protein